MIAILSAFLIFLPSCKVAEKALNKGDYDKTIDLCVNKLSKNKNKPDKVLLLEQAFRKANKRDLDRIAFLNKDGQPERHQAVLDLYYQISRRQNKIMPLLPLYLESPKRVANFDMVATNEAIVSTRKNVAEFLYVKSNKLMTEGDKMDARRAYGLLKELKTIYPGFRDVDTQIDRAINLGTNHVLVQTHNSTGSPLPPQIEQNLRKISLSNLNQQWLSFYTNKGNRAYDYDVKININRIEITPEQLTERLFKAEKEVKDGWQYAKDKSGRVLVDSLGKKIKEDVYRMVFADVVQVQQQKRGTIHASVDVLDTSSRQLIGSYPVSSNADFSNVFATFHGNPDALDCDTQELTNNRFSPFPSNEELAVQASQGLKQSLLDLVRENRRLLLD